MIFILAFATFLGGAAIGGLGLVVMGIRRGDRAIDFVAKPSTHVEALTRRVLGVGIRTAEHSEDERGEL
ncbi:MAG: hypothetical protein JO345_22930 [Streptosporangiaceae bacterium]|nr:hypothetical protein [Streptosporangiaceae bacterium]